MGILYTQRTIQFFSFTSVPPLFCGACTNAMPLTAAGLAQSVEHLTTRAGGHGFDSDDQTNTQGLKNDWEMKVLPLSCKWLDLHVGMEL